MIAVPGRPRAAAASSARAASPFDRRVLVLCGLCAAVALAATAAASALGALIAFVTQLAWFGRLSIAPASPATNALGAAAFVVPVAGGSSSACSPVTGRRRSAVTASPRRWRACS